LGSSQKLARVLVTSLRDGCDLLDVVGRRLQAQISAYKKQAIPVGSPVFYTTKGAFRLDASQLSLFTIRSSWRSLRSAAKQS